MTCPVIAQLVERETVVVWVLIFFLFFFICCLTSGP